MDVHKMVSMVKAFCSLYLVDKEFLEYDTIYIFDDENLKIVEKIIIENLTDEVDYKDEYYGLITEIVDRIAKSSIIEEKPENKIKTEIKNKQSWENFKINRLNNT